MEAMEAVEQFLGSCRVVGVGQVEEGLLVWSGQSDSRLMLLVDRENGGQAWSQGLEIQGSVLRQLLVRSKGQAVYLDLEGERLRIKVGTQGVFWIPGTPVEIPSVPVMEGVAVDPTWVSVLGSLPPFCRTTYHPHLQSVATVQEQGLDVVATDGYRMVVYRLAGSIPVLPPTCAISAAAIKSLAACFRALPAATIRVAYESPILWLHAQGPGWRWWWSTPVVQEYVNYRLPEPPSQALVLLSKEELVEALKRLLLLQERLAVDLNHRITLFTPDPAPTYGQEPLSPVLLQPPTQPLRICFNGTFLLSALEKIPSDRVLWRFSNPTQPFFLYPSHSTAAHGDTATPGGYTSLRALVMPIQNTTVPQPRFQESY